MRYEQLLRRRDFVQYGYRKGHSVWRRGGTEVAVWPCGLWRIWPNPKLLHTPRGTNEVNLEKALIALDTLRHNKICACTGSPVRRRCQYGECPT